MSVRRIFYEDKIYYSRKNRDHWVDISDNETARKNLYNFVGHKYNFRGYEDEESNIWQKIKEGKFDYTKYRNNQNSVNPVVTEEEKKKLLPSVVKSKKQFVKKHTNVVNQENQDKTNVFLVRTNRLQNTPVELLNPIIKTWDPDNLLDLSNSWEKMKVWMNRQINKITKADEEQPVLILPEITQPSESKYAFMSPLFLYPNL